ncbi:MAG: hypothetical protein COA78_07440 [Blastopirellula sp.]|nr:MAG: hypothetical protein COA78_07440 [Blastopirellula sp.]
MKQPNDQPTDFKSVLDSMFVPKNQELWEKLWEQVQDEERLEHLEKATGIHDQELLKHLLELGITEENLAAMALYPLLLVAWSDGILTVEERNVIMQAATEWHIEEGHASYQLLHNWLEEGPKQSSIDVWKTYVKAILAEMNEEQQAKMKKGIIDRARNVVNAFGGILGRWGNTISHSEEACLKDLEETFD